MGEYWENFGNGEMLGTDWENVVNLFGKCWESIGVMLGTNSGNFRNMLRTNWENVGNMFGNC